MPKCTLNDIKVIFWSLLQWCLEKESQTVWDEELQLPILCVSDHRVGQRVHGAHGQGHSLGNQHSTPSLLSSRSVSGQTVVMSQEYEGVQVHVF